MTGPLAGRAALAEPKLLSLEIREVAMDQKSDCWWSALLAVSFE